jgi:hypothetical protein
MTYFIIIVMIVWVWMAWEISRAPHIDENDNIKHD